MAIAGLTVHPFKEVLRRDAMLPEIAELMIRITGNTRGSNDAFKMQMVDWYLHRVYDELDGPLTGAIAPIPPR